MVSRVPSPEEKKLIEKKKLIEENRILKRAGKTLDATITRLRTQAHELSEQHEAVEDAYGDLLKTVEQKNREIILLQGDVHKVSERYFTVIEQLSQSLLRRIR